MASTKPARSRSRSTAARSEAEAPAATTPVPDVEETAREAAELPVRRAERPAEPAPVERPNRDAAKPAPEAALTHPEEIRGTLTLTIGERAVLQASGRLTPAGLVTTGIMVASILLSAASLVWSARRRP
ncbi:hypothetical protein [Roseicella sp. DB1501]|uniref:hypothetical protein n=1 Tax=Roseicella sp. DB1501 TaxID=2730925 RepID=UPI0014931611|nr:hypothetical protein [Roseicella sp. DB1501]NOG68974.1 hypothetical protein [Roseicella sp. DB1501]